ncbi:hypothetical protein COU61_00820 [Candidatus Pacearchaeota archaeon CG10_big_fil_rev_8_21_14_0_10_35_13]|nr:MAG: hypothetical protein COU61_00820 [Candidatus Pacearchaeota archaeon CG10_big_fil_rev_8_21_14_0_10_35_13]
MKYKFLLVIFTISLIASLILTLTPTPIICTEGCEVVQTTTYAYTLGIKNSAYGTVIFTVLMLIVALQIKKPKKTHRKIIHLAIITGSIVSLYFLYLQAFVINSWCKYCLIVDIGMIVALGIAIVSWKK